MSGIQLQQVTKQYKEGTSTLTVLKEATLTVNLVSWWQLQVHLDREKVLYYLLSVH